jgi:hypothetical protein
MNRNATYLFLLVSIGLLPLTVGGQVTQARVPNQSVKGSWSLVLTRLPRQEPRILEFTQVGNVITGSYITKSGGSKSISSARISNGYFYFRVADLKLYFEMRFVGDGRLEGKMTDYGSTEKKPADPVRMTRRVMRR